MKIINTRISLNMKVNINTHTHTHIYIYIYIYTGHTNNDACIWCNNNSNKIVNSKHEETGN